MPDTPRFYPYHSEKEYNQTMETNPIVQQALAVREDLVRSGRFLAFNRSGYVELVLDPPVLSGDIKLESVQTVLLHFPVRNLDVVSAARVGEKDLVAIKFTPRGNGLENSI